MGATGGRGSIGLAALPNESVSPGARRANGQTVFPMRHHQIYTWALRQRVAIKACRSPDCEDTFAETLYEALTAVDWERDLTSLLLLLIPLCFVLESIHLYYICVISSCPNTVTYILSSPSLLVSKAPQPRNLHLSKVLPRVSSYHAQPFSLGLRSMPQMSSLSNTCMRKQFTRYLFISSSTDTLDRGFGASTHTPLFMSNRTASTTT
jgi:hypothetical protein